MAPEQYRDQHDQRDLDGKSARSRVAALCLQTSTSASPSTVRNAIVNTGSPGVISEAGSGSPNRLLYSLPTSAPPRPPPSGCGLTESFGGTLSGTGDFEYHPERHLLLQRFGHLPRLLARTCGHRLRFVSVQTERVQLGGGRGRRKLGVVRGHRLYRHLRLLPVGGLLLQRKRQLHLRDAEALDAPTSWLGGGETRPL